MSNIRTGKERAYSASASGAGAYRFDSLAPVAMFYVTGALAASVVNTTVQDVYVCPQNLVIVKLAIVYNTGAAFVAGSDKWNIVVNSAAAASATGDAEGGASAAAQTLAVAGNSVFAADKAFAQASVSKFFCVDQVIPDVPEAFYGAGTILSLRAVTTAAAGTHLAAAGNFSLQVFGLVAPYDPKYWVNTANPATDF